MQAGSRRFNLMRFAKLGMILVSGAVVLGGVGCLPGGLCNPTSLLTCEAEAALGGVVDGALTTVGDVILGIVPDVADPLVQECLDQAGAYADLWVANRVPGECPPEE